MIEISEIHATLDEGATEQTCLAVGRRAISNVLHCDPKIIEQLILHRKSIDARKKNDVHFILSFRASIGDASNEISLYESASPRARKHLRLIESEDPAWPTPLNRPAPLRPVVVGAGCAGLFAALTLAKAGLKPLLIERGADAKRRTDDIEVFLRDRQLDPESNIQFGLGGAGTFSDGKLNTGTKNPTHRLILEALVEAGAPRDILWDAKPHIGSDILPLVVERLAAQIVSLGGEVRYHTKLHDIQFDDCGSVAGIDVVSTALGKCAEAEQIRCNWLILACGHSARDVFSMLRNHHVALARKTFAMGVRIEHMQRDIDRVQYGKAAGHPSLGAAPYKLVAHLPSGRSVFSFCMCPGGEVVAASSEPGALCVNGASLHARAGVNANAALLVNVTPDDLPGTDPLAGIELQRSCEQKAYRLGGGNWRAPSQLVGDFLERRPSTGPGRITPSYPLGVTWTELDSTLPEHIITSLRNGIPLLGRKLRGYDCPDAVLTGVETRSSSPVTIVRDKTCHAQANKGLYPCGEGAGYAGGIMSAAADGIRCAQALLADL